MKKALLFIIISLIPFRYYAQLGPMSITSMPSCLLAPGVTGTMTGTPIPGATGYEWISTIGPSQSIWFPNSPGPFVTAVPSVDIMCNLSQQAFQICVRAFNANDTSPWSCGQITGILNIPVLAAANSPVALPGDTGYYTIENAIMCADQYVWTITGDATFNNNLQSITVNGTFNLGLNINFGPNFTSGTLCVAAGSNIGLFTDTVCMVITAPVGISEPELNFSFVSGEDKIIIEYSSIVSDVIHARIFDLSGRCLTNESVAVSNNQNHLEFSTAHLQQGSYIIELVGKYLHEQFRFVLSE